jgi:hypothetical protein
VTDFIVLFFLQIKIIFDTLMLSIIIIHAIKMHKKD